MFVQAQANYLQIHLNTAAQLERESTKGFNTVLQFFNGQYHSRILPTVNAATSALYGLVTESTKGLSELVAGVISLNSQSLKNSFIFFRAALIDAISLPILGLITLLAPRGAVLSATEWAAGFSNKFVQMDAEHTYLTRDFNQLTGRIFSPIRGITLGIDSVVNAIQNLVKSVFEFPVSNISLISIFQRFIKGAQDQDRSSISDALAKLFAGATGIISNDSRTSITIFTN